MSVESNLHDMENILVLFKQVATKHIYTSMKKHLIKCFLYHVFATTLCSKDAV
jgi:hypothetical protein